MTYATRELGLELVRDVVGTGPCHPCSRMASALGPGGFQALRDDGGITARVVNAGVSGVGDPVEVIGK